MHKTINITKLVATGAVIYLGLVALLGLIAMALFYVFVTAAQWLIIAAYEGWITEQQMLYTSAGGLWIITSLITLKAYRAAGPLLAEWHTSLSTTHASRVKAISLRRLYNGNRHFNSELPITEEHQEEIGPAGEARPATQFLKPAQ